MSEVNEGELSHYLWSLDNALTGLITLCNKNANNIDKYKSILGQVDEKLNIWIQHKIKFENEQKEKEIEIEKEKQRLEEERKQKEMKEMKERQDKKEKTNNKPMAWGDCSDEDSSDLDGFPEAIGLCKPTPNGHNNDNNDNNDSNDNIDHNDHNGVNNDMNGSNINGSNINGMDKTKDADDDDKKKHEQIKPKQTKQTKQTKENIFDMQHILDAPLFVDDTQNRDDDTKQPQSIQSIQSAQSTQLIPKGLTWAQRTKKNQSHLLNKPISAPYNQSSTNMNKNDEQYEMSSTHSKESNNSKSSSSRKRSNRKKRSQQHQQQQQQQNKDKEKKKNKDNKDGTGWSKVKKSKIFTKKQKEFEQRNRSSSIHGNKSQQQKLNEAEEKRKLQIERQKQRNKERDQSRKKKIEETQKKEKYEAEEKKKAMEERLLKAEENRKKTDLLKKEKVIKDDVRREEIRIARECQEQEKKSAIFEKQVAAEIRKLQKNLDITRKAASKEKKAKDIQLKQEIKIKKQKELQDKKLMEAAKRKEIEQEKKAKERKNSLSNIQNNNNKGNHHNKKKRNNNNKNKQNKNKNKGSNNNNSSKRDKTYSKMHGMNKSEMLKDSEIINDSERNKYYNSKIIDKGLIEYYAMPKLNNCTTMAKDQIQHFYSRTKSLAINVAKSGNTNNLNYKLMEDAIKELLKTTVDINFEDIHYNNDVLLVINRLISFDINKMPFKCAKLTIHNLVLYSVNNIGAQLLALKYLDKLFLFLNQCIIEYFYKNNQLYHTILPQICLILNRIYSKISINDTKYESRIQYKQFKLECIHYVLFESYNASILVKISNFYKSLLSISNISKSNDIMNKYMEETKIFDGFISILIPIADLIKDINNNNNDQSIIIFDLILNQLKYTKCAGILNFMLKLVFYDNGKNNNNDISKYCSSTIILLNGCIAYLNCICKIDLKMLSSLIIEYEMEIYHIFVILLQYTSINFMQQVKQKHIGNNHDKHIGNIRELCKGLLEFITFLSMNNTKIQDMFRFITKEKPTLLTQLCQFPFFFFINNEGKLSLFPALISITFNNKENLNVLSQTLNTKHIHNWLKKNIFEYANKIQKNQQLSLSQKIFEQKVPIQIWSKCLELY